MLLALPLLSIPAKFGDISTRTIVHADPSYSLRTAYRSHVMYNSNEMNMDFLARVAVTTCRRGLHIHIDFATSNAM